MTTQLIFFFVKTSHLQFSWRGMGTWKWCINAIIMLVSTLNWPRSNQVITENDSQKKNRKIRGSQRYITK